MLWSLRNVDLSSRESALPKMPWTGLNPNLVSAGQVVSQLLDSCGLAFELPATDLLWGPRGAIDPALVAIIRAGFRWLQ